MLHDAHFHTDDFAFVTFMQMHGIQGIANAASPMEFCRLKNWLKQSKSIQISAGIHPWNADTMPWEEMQPILEQARIIGEIGLDNVWCEVPLLKQLEVFEHQLAYASQHHKPVILHVKGLEKEAIPYLKSYKNHYFVHWYSCDAYLEQFIDLDCYFSIGPSVYKDKAVQQVAKQVPLHRLLIESDGLSALSWCEERPVQINEYLDMMKRSIEWIGMLREEADIEKHLTQNLQRFLSL